jgi:hypothetical protein
VYGVAFRSDIENRQAVKGAAERLRSPFVDYSFRVPLGRIIIGTVIIKEAIVRNHKFKAEKFAIRSLCALLVVAVGSTAAGLGSVVGGGEGLAANPEAVSAAGVIERYIQACGGPALSEVKAERRKGTLVRGQSGAVPFEAVSKAGGKWVYNQVFAYGDQVTYSCDGTSAWVQDTKGVDSLSGAMRLDLEMLLDVQAPLRLREFFPEMNLKGIEKRGGREMVVILAKSRDGRDVELAFDNESGLLAKAGDLAFEDYRAAGKVKRPHRVFIGDDPAGLALRLKMEFKEIVQDAPVEDSAFSRPACVLPMRVSPLFKPRLYIRVSDEALEACAGVYRHPTNPGLIYTVTRQQNHLMMERTGWGQALEVMPESELDYSIRFLNFEFHFVRDSAGRVTALEIGPERSVRAEKIK